MRVAMIGLAALLIASTAQAQDTPLVTQVKQIAQECQNKRLTGQVRGFVGSVKCSNQRLAELATAHHAADGDLIAMFLARRLEIAERMDARKLTEGQGQIEMVRAYQEAEQAQLARQSRTAAAAQAQAAQAQLQATQMQAAQARQYRPDPGCFLRGMANSGALSYTVPFQSGQVPAGLAAGLAGAAAACN